MTWKDNIKDLGEMLRGLDTDRTQNYVQWYALISLVLNLCVLTPQCWLT